MQCALSNNPNSMSGAPLSFGVRLRRRFVGNGSEECISSRCKQQVPAWLPAETLHIQMYGSKRRTNLPVALVEVVKHGID